MQKYILFCLALFISSNLKADYLDQAETKANGSIEELINTYYTYEEKYLDKVHITQETDQEEIGTLNTNTVTLIRLPKDEACKISYTKSESFQNLKKLVCSKISNASVARLEAKLSSFNDCPNIQYKYLNLYANELLGLSGV